MKTDYSDRLPSAGLIELIAALPLLSGIAQASSLGQQLPDSILAGGFRHRFSGSQRGSRLISWMHNFRCRCTRVFYGDQAMFIRASLFAELGGFPDAPVLKDLLFSEKIAKVTTPLTMNSHVITDSRKFEQAGVWLSLLRVILIQLSHELKLPTPARRFFSNIRQA